jgi:hypothetical protein
MEFHWPITLEYGMPTYSGNRTRVSNLFHEECGVESGITSNYLLTQCESVNSALSQNRVISKA